MLAINSGKTAEDGCDIHWVQSHTGGRFLKGRRLHKEINSRVVCRESGLLAHYFNLESCQSLSKGSLILPQSFQGCYESRSTISRPMLGSWVMDIFHLGGHEPPPHRVCPGHRGCVDEYKHPASQRWQQQVYNISPAGFTRQVCHSVLFIQFMGESWVVTENITLILFSMSRDEQGT